MVLNHVSGEAEKVNVVNNLTRTPRPKKTIIMKRMNMDLMIRWGVSDQTPKVLIWIIGIDVKETKVSTMVTATERVSMSIIKTTILTTTSTGSSIVKGMIGSDHMFLLKIGNLP